MSTPQRRTSFATPSLRMTLPPVQRALISFAAILPLPAAATAQGAPGQGQDLGKQVDALFIEWDRNDSPGCALAVYRDGETVYQNGYGIADLEHDVPITPSTVVYIGSASKQFVAALIVLLEQDGKLSLDDEVHKHVPEFPDYQAVYGRGVTIRQLIHHTSGVRDNMMLWMLTGRDYKDHVPLDAIFDLVCRQKELNFPPGEQFLYSNSNYLLLATIIENVSGQSLREHADARIFKPLGMRNTHFHDDNTHLIKNRAFCYGTEHGGRENLILRYDLVGSGGLYTTVEDLARWDRNFYDNQLGRGGAELIETMHTRGKLHSGEQIPYAFALMHDSYRGLPVVMHGGALGGYRTQLVRFPEQRLSIAILGNFESFDPGGMAQKVADLYLAEYFTEASTEEAAAVPEGEPEVADVDPAIFARYAGIYEMRPGVTVTVTLQDGQLRARPTGQDGVRLYPLSETEYFITVDDVILTFSQSDDEDENSVYDRLTLREGSQTMVAFRTGTTDDPSDTGLLAEFAGSYTSDELGVTYEISKGDRWLSVKVGYLAPFRLAGTDTDTFVSGPRNFSFQRDDNGAITGFEIDAGRVLGLKFQRR